MKDARRIDGLIDEMVDDWHYGGWDAEMTLAEFLGLTDEQYARWAEDPGSLHDYIATLPEPDRRALLVLADEMARPGATDEERESACKAAREIFRQEPVRSMTLEETLQQTTTNPWSSQVPATPMADLRAMMEKMRGRPVPIEDAFPAAADEPSDDDDIEGEWEEALAAAREHYGEFIGSAPTLEAQFGPGTHGFTEAIDRVHVAASMWEDHVAGHPGITLDLGRYRLARKIAGLMAELYQMCGTADFDAEEGDD